MISGPRDRELIDTLDALGVRRFDERVWRVVREGRDPTLCAAGGNRWDDGTFEVLYTSLERLGAIAEMRFHLRRGQPLIPSKIRYRVHELHVSLDGVVDLTDWTLLSRLGVDQATFGRLPYLDRESEYTACQRVAEAVHFLGSEAPGDPSGMLVPNARHAATNLVIFGDYVPPDDIRHVADHGLIDWD